jgi:hypothetical protein
MATTSYVEIHIWTDGDSLIGQIISCAPNTASLAEINHVKLEPGSNVIEHPMPTLPIGEPGYIVTGVLIVPPPDNTRPLLFKAFDMDNGYALHPSNPTFLSLWNGPPSGFYLDYAGTNPIMVKFIWV